ncbi:MAG: hypothetical protein K6U04_02525 [Armatimonadetes bacterium]|nr:hypothetical protein [Armatimonadota bacterium]
MGEVNISLEDVIKVRELERALNEFPGVEACAVLIEELPGGEKELIAFVQLDEKCTVEKEALRAQMTKKIDVSMRVKFCELPKTPTGKIARHLLKAAGDR